MKVLVTGADGQLGKEIVLMLQAKGEDVLGIGRTAIDFSKPDTVADGIASYQADWVLNCAAYTQVDKAEEERELAFLVNRDAAKAVAEGVKRYGGRLLHVSTDFIFDGNQSHPYREDDTANPLSVYGQSKWEGEQVLCAVLPETIVLRTAWVYGVHGHNFVKTILRLAADREELQVVDDQIGTPTWTRDISMAMLTLIRQNAEGIYHFTNEGVASWYDFASSIVEKARSLGLPVRARGVFPISSSDYQTAADRPAYSVLSKEKTRKVLGYDIPHWRASLGEMLISIQNNSGEK